MTQHLIYNEAIKSKDLYSIKISVSEFNLFDLSQQNIQRTENFLKASRKRFRFFS